MQSYFVVYLTGKGPFSHVRTTVIGNTINAFLFFLKALNKLNANWNFCTDTATSTGICNGLDVAVDCSRRSRLAREAVDVRAKRQATPDSDDVYDVKITFPSVK